VVRVRRRRRRRRREKFRNGDVPLFHSGALRYQVVGQQLSSYPSPAI
jgi:hypothetical protein